MPKIVVITQSNYLPWRGYFDLLRMAHEFVVLDAVQYTRRDWRNRNLIKTAYGLRWLTIPVVSGGLYHQAIDETRIADGLWAKKHIRAIEAAYAKAPFYSLTAPWLFEVLESLSSEPMLSRVNLRLLSTVCERLGVSVNLRSCDEIIDRNRLRAMEPTDRIIAIVKAVGADHYLTGQAARAYLNLEKFSVGNIKIDWMSYENYLRYPQLWGGFEPNVSIVDLLMNTGPEASTYLTKTEAASGHVDQ